MSLGQQPGAGPPDLFGGGGGGGRAGSRPALTASPSMGGSRGGGGLRPGARFTGGGAVPPRWVPLKKSLGVLLEGTLGEQDA
jgi:hypothetical protein